MPNDDRTAAFDREMDAAAAYTKALLSGEPTPGSVVPPASTADHRASAIEREMDAAAAYTTALLAGSLAPNSSAQGPAIADARSAEAKGAEETRALIAIAGQPGARRDAAPGAAVGADAAAGAAEARRLLGKE